MNNSKGFTTVELIVAIAIVGVIMGAVASFLTHNIQNFNATKDVIDIQYEGQIGMNQFTRIARESTGVARITDDGGALKDSDFNEIILGDIDFIHYEHNGTTEEETTYTLTYDTSDADNKKLRFRYVVDDGAGTITSYPASGDDYILMQYVEDLRVEPASTSSTPVTFDQARAMVIKVVMEQDKASFDVQTEVSFRNRDHR